jgi:N6-L-threonylcarbamoyladenine synthase
MLTLGIETSCDETSAAVVNDTNVLSNIVATQTVHEQYGGVVPEFASRAHIRQLLPIMRMALDQAGVSFASIDGIAVTRGPGLAGSLLVGVCIAKGMSLSMKIPLIGINHIEGHIAAAAADDPHFDYPFIAMVASGGHSLLVHIEQPFSYHIIGQTIDDAAGEAFDKVAKVLALGYPGGPAVERAARQGTASAVEFPRALMEKENLNFSFSGLKTSVLYHVRSLQQQNKPIPIADIAAGFQQAIIDVLVEKTFRALDLHRCRHLVLAGGVIRNSALRSAFESTCAARGIQVRIPAPLLCTDNAGMIARAGHFRLAAGQSSGLDLDVAPNLRLMDGDI